ncbi:MAG: GspE/PulE family protein [Pseudomonadota bacterium]
MLREQLLINAAISQGLLETRQLEEARRRSLRSREPLMRTLSQVARLPAEDFYRAYAQENGLPFMRGSQLRANPAAVTRLTPAFIRQRLALPVIDARGPCVACANPNDPMVQRHLRRTLGDDVTILLAEPEALAEAVHQQVAVPEGNEAITQIPAWREFEAVQMLDEVLSDAYLRHASDVHFVPQRDSFVVSTRVDGRLQEYPRPFTPEQGVNLLSRIKVLAQLDIAESRMPQDGAITHRMTDGTEFDIRVATLPARYGERATLRLLGAEEHLVTLGDLGLEASDAERFREVVRRPHGIILITGPTGSGKSTTLYAVLDEIADEEVNVLTAEDPIERPIEGITQLQTSVKVDFAGALRSFLRHDPDVIMVGEIRDGETANIAIKASLTGHLVLSTLHTNSALGSIMRLRDMGTESYLVAATLACAVAQRLVRRLCERCKESAPLPAAMATLLGDEYPQSHMHVPRGCAYCRGSGYRGRIALFEFLWVDDELSRAIAAGADEATLGQIAGVDPTLRSDGLAKLQQGVTSLDELQRIGLLPFTGVAPGVPQAVLDQGVS